MFEEFWTGILELTAKFVIPDWSAVIALLPILILALTVLVLVGTFWKLFRAPKAGRGKRRAAPRTPEGIHMPGPSLAPVLASIGAFLLFLGLVFGGPVLVLGAIALVLTLLYWLAEAVRIYDHDLGPTATTLPAVVHDGPPAGVHMPGPSFLPFVGAIGMAMLFLGLVFGEWLLAVGVIALVVTLLGWLVDARKEYVKTEEADTTGHLENIPPPRTPRTLLAGLAMLLVAGFVIQVGWIPPRAASEGEGATPSGVPGEPVASAGAGGDVVVHAKDVAFLEGTFTAPADKAFKLEFFNDDASIQHNLEIKDESGTSVFKGEIFAGVDTRVYDVPALAAGTYPFSCTVHPNMTGTATLQ